MKEWKKKYIKQKWAVKNIKGGIGFGNFSINFQKHCVENTERGSRKNLESGLMLPEAMDNEVSHSG